MKDERKTKKVLIEELDALRQRVAELEVRSTDHPWEEIQLQSEQKFRDLVNNSPKGIILADEKGSHLLVNKRATEITGYSTEKLLNLTIKEIMPPDERNKYIEMYQEIIEGDPSPRQYEHSIVRKDGSIVHTELTATNTIWDGKVCALLSIHDITERKQTESLLKMEINRAQSYFDVAGIMLLVINADQEVELINQRGCEVLGYSDEEIIGKNWFTNFLPIRLRDETQMVFKRIMTGDLKSAEFYENQVLTRHGGERLISWHNTVLVDEQGEIIGTLSSGEDITERKKADEALKEYSERLEELVEERTAELKESEAKARAQYRGIPMPTYTWQRVEEDFVLIDYNDAAVEITNGGINDYLGAKASEMYGDRPQIQQEIERCFTEKSIIEREMQYEYLSSGEYKYLAVKYAFVHPDLVIIHTEDITARVETQERLVRSERLAALGQIAGSIAHELRNPLGVISNASYFLKTLLSDGDEKVLEYTEILTEEVNNASRIIEGLLDSSRTTSSEKTATPIRSIVSHINEIHAPPDEIQLKVNIPDDLPEVLVDSKQVEMAVRNLLLNGYEAMPEGGELRIEAFPGEGEINVSVSDTGCGIPEENVEKIFDPLYTTKPRGIGLGLTISKQLIDANGGKIEVESTIGKGTVFTITLPTA